MADDAPGAVRGLASEVPVAKQGQTVPPTDILGQQSKIRSGVTSALGNVLGINDAMRAASGQMTPEEEQNFVMMAVAGMVAPELRGAGAVAEGVAEAAPSLAKSIRAYHGSPHDFERFDLSKIGTGEGAQAYGHGLYFAENPSVARDYKAKLATQEAIRPDEEAIASIKPKWDEIVAKLRDAREKSGGRMTDETSALQNHLDALNDHAIADTIARKPYLKEGRMYEVDINADPEHFLDYDKPLSEQSPKVQPLLAEAVQKEAYNRALASTNKARADELWSFVKDPSKAPAGFAQELLRKPEFTQQLREAGIPGIKYLDQGSRGAQSLEEIQREIASYKQELANPNSNIPRDKLESGLATFQKRLEDYKPPSSNYVVFDDKLIDILKKYGWAALAALGLGAAPQPDKN